MTNNKTENQGPEGSDTGPEGSDTGRPLEDTWVAKWKPKKLNRSFANNYSRSNILGAIVSSGIGLWLVSKATQFWRDALAAVAAAAKRNWDLIQSQNGQEAFLSWLAVRIAEMQNRSLNSSLSPTSWGERAERKSQLPGLWGVMGTITVVKTVSAPDGSTEVLSEEERFVRLDAELIAGLHAQEEVELGEGMRLTLNDLLCGLVHLGQEKLVDELLRWAREPYNAVADKRESAFRSLLKEITPVLGGRLSQFPRTKRGLLSASHHQAGWRSLQECLMANAELFFARLEQAVGRDFCPYWASKRLNKVRAIMQAMAERPSVWMDVPTGNSPVSRTSNYWNLVEASKEGSGAAANPFGSYGWVSTCPTEALRAWAAGRGYNCPPCWGQLTQILMDSENAYTLVHAPSLFGGHGLKDPQEILDYVRAQKTSPSRKRSAQFRRAGLPVENIPPALRNGDGRYYNLSNSNPAFARRLVEEEGSPYGVASKALKYSEKALRETLEEMALIYKKDQSWIDWKVTQCVKEAQPLLDAVFGAHHGDFVLQDEAHDEYHEEY